MESKDKKDGKVIRDFWLSTWALNNKNTVYLIMLITVFFGAYSYVSLPKELFPEIKIPTIMVQTIYPGNPPVDIENLISRPLEKEIESVKGIKKLTSISSQDASSIFVEFNTDVEIKTAMQDVKDAVDKAKKDLPDDLLDDPAVEDIDVSEFPVINVNLSGDFGMNELKDYAEDLSDEFETVSEVSKVNITGITEREVSICLDPFKMSALEVSYKNVEDAVSFENMSMSGGEIRIGDINRSIRMIGEFDKPEEIENIIVKFKDDGTLVYLKDVATVELGSESYDWNAIVNKKQAALIGIYQLPGSNSLQIKQAVVKILFCRGIREQIMPGIAAILGINQSTIKTGGECHRIINRKIIADHTRPGGLIRRINHKCIAIIRSDTKSISDRY